MIENVEPAGNSHREPNSTPKRAKRADWRLHVTVDGPEPRRLIVTGRQVVRTLSALIEAGSKGITALDVSNTWALRLGHYIFELRRRWNLAILTQYEDHDGGHHGRYVLLDHVRIEGGADA